MSDIYAAPVAELNEPAFVEGYGSLDRAINGDYEFNVGDTMSEAWAKTKGAKGVINMAFFLYMVVYIVLAIGLEFFFSALGFPMSVENLGVIMIKNVIITIFALPMGAGLFLLGARRSVDVPLSSTSIFNYFNKTLPLFATAILMYFFIILGFIALVIPGIYLSLSYYMAMPLVVEKGLSPWQALEVSRKAVSKRWFAVLGLGMLVGMINLLGVLSLGIGMIWTLPMTLIAFGILYRNMFGLEAETLAA